MLPNTTQSKIGAVILAAGLGKRMNSTMLKVMHLLNGKPLIDYVVGSVEDTGLIGKPTLIVCDDDSSVQDYLGSRAEYVIQRERLGTGHAVSVAEPVLKGQVEHIVVLYGDMPFVSSDSIRRLVERHVERDNLLTMMTVTVPDFSDWRAAFLTFSRVIRGADGHIMRSIEKKDCTPADLEITELNPCIYCFNSEWLWNNIKNLKNNNAQQEYYLTDLIQETIAQGKKISSISIEPKEAIGINSQDDLKTAENLI